MQNQTIQHPELPKTEITHRSCRIAFLSDDSNSNVSLLNHTHIITTITNSQHN